MDRWVAAGAVDGGAVAALRALLAALLERGVVDALLVQRPAPGGDSLVHAVVSRADELADADPVAPVMPVQAARLVSALTAGGAPYRLGAVLKPCEVRATIELAKLKQADLSQVLPIAVDCLGTYELRDYAALLARGEDPTAHALANGARGAVAPLPGAEFRAACRICTQPVWPEAGAVDAGLPRGCLTVGLLGLGGQVLVAGPEEELDALGYPPATAEARGAAVAALVAGRTAAREQEFAAWQARVRDADSLLAEFSRCIRCHNCMENCPLCYCKECLFRGATFDHRPAHYAGRVARRGTVRLPADTLLFHLTRLNHMVGSCVGCGACASACPSQLPVATLFGAVGRKVQALFDYHPGRSLHDELPLSTFREDELPGVAE